jgi:monoamine oxidase
MEFHPYYDIIIVGAGIAGLYCASELAEKYPGKSICVLEKYKMMGGRLHTYRPKVSMENVQWESGAGRVHSSHGRVHKLLKKYGLTLAKIDPKISYKSSPIGPVEKNIFEKSVIPIILGQLTQLDKSTLAKNTLENILHKILGHETASKLISYFPYRSELTTLRADIALNSFLHQPIGTNNHYSVVAEGFGALIRRIIDDLPDNVTVLGRHELLGLEKVTGHPRSTDLIFRYNENKEIRLRAGEATILTLHSTALRSITPFQTFAPLRYLKTTPLLRIYMIFAEPWFAGMGKVVFPSAPRYMIPIDEKKGIIMISYTDDDDTKHYSGLVDRYGDESAELTKAVMRDVRRWFSDLRIPNPTYTKAHLWKVGTTYWIPHSEKTAEELAAQINHPFPRSMPGVYVCGESYSPHNQAWVEGALESAEGVLRLVKIEK